MTQPRRFGYGCNRPGAPGTKGVVGEASPRRRAAVCPGDSGGPVVDAATGQLRRMTCSTYLDVDLTAQRGEIDDAIEALTGAPSPDRGWRGCRSASNTLLFGDVDADGDLDAICHDRADGALRLFANKGPARLIGDAHVVVRGFCRGARAEILAADFDGDRRLDLLCRRLGRASSAAFFVEDGRDGVSLEEALIAARCDSPDASLHAGDVDGDGRSDLVCQDRAAGVLAVDLSAGGRSAPFDGRPDVRVETSFCSGPDSAAHMGRWRMDSAKAGLICFTKSIGAIEVVEERSLVRRRRRPNEGLSRLGSAMRRPPGSPCSASSLGARLGRSVSSPAAGAFALSARGVRRSALAGRRRRSMRSGLVENGLVVNDFCISRR